MAKSYALLIGTNVNGLSVAKIDVKNMQEILNQHKISNIKILEDENATKNNILYNFKSIVHRVKRGDWVYFFFSGHGTSENAPDIDSKLKNRLKDTGAIMSYDDKYIIVKEDLHKYFEELDNKNVHLVIILDTCFSGNSYKDFSLSSNIDDKPLKFLSKFTQKEKFPYKHLIFMSATTSNDYAVEKGKEGSYFTLALKECLKDNTKLLSLKGCINKKSLPQTPVFLPEKNISIFP